MHLTPKHLALLADNQLTATTLFNAFGGAPLERGIAYFEAGHVMSYQAENNINGNVIITAKVQGSAQQLYTTVVQYNANAPKWITGVCTCPATMGCKHAVAVLFAYLEHVSKHKLREPRRRDQAIPFLAATMPTAPVLKRSPVDLWLNALANLENRPAPPLFNSNTEPSVVH
ncbi:MAG: SWIM zinc finger domain-containing protein, partial [Thiothrix sp.]